MEHTTDFAGQTVRIGDYIYFAKTGDHPDRCILRVEKITDCGTVQGRTVKRLTHFGSNLEVWAGRNFVKVPFNE
jgi:hypothetical protein